MLLCKKYNKASNEIIIESLERDSGLKTKADRRAITRCTYYDTFGIHVLTNGLCLSTHAS